jgi:hypothetical protein
MQRMTDGVELDAQPSTEPRHEGMAGLAKGLAIIEAFAVRDVMSVADAARRRERRALRPEDAC